MTRLALGTERSVSRRPAEASLISSALRPKLSADVRRELSQPGEQLLSAVGGLVAAGPGRKQQRRG
jgi:hypothetical protein